MSKYVLTILTVLIAGSCRSSLPVALTEVEGNAIIDRIRHTLKDYHTGIRKSGLLAELKYLDSSSRFFWVPRGYANAISYDSTVSVLKRNAANYKSIDSSFSTLRIIPLSKNSQLILPLLIPPSRTRMIEFLDTHLLKQAF